MLLSKPHSVADATGKSFALQSSAETKVNRHQRKTGLTGCQGILGSDNRYYVLDVYRLTPPDVLFLPKDLNGTVALV